jgi:hypothetical protein
LHPATRRSANVMIAVLFVILIILGVLEHRRRFVEPKTNMSCEL